MVASLGLCSGYYAAWYLKRHGIKDHGLTVDVDALSRVLDIEAGARPGGE
jgi:uncharacterized OsmC-like protein